MAAPAHNANGHRRRGLVKRVKAEESDCALCDQPVDKTLLFITGEHGKRCPSGDCTGCMPDPMRGEVDEDIPRARGGSPYERSNCHLMHRKCNQYKGDMTLSEARAKLHGSHDTGNETPRQVEASPIW
jgi:5-methylcytosine-specific restriction endonuclease McrA